MAEKVCTGHYCQGKRRPLSEFNVHRTGPRAGKPFSRCRRCWNWQRRHPKRRKGWMRLVPVEDFRAVVEELRRRIGVTEAARRMGVSVEHLSDHRLAEKAAVREQTFTAAKRVLKEAERNGEDGWDTREARIRNLNPILAGYASGEARRAGSLVRKYLADHPTIPRDVAAKLLSNVESDWTWQQIDNEADKLCLEWERAMDFFFVESQWAYPDKDGRLRPFADFECQHGRLPGDKTPPCGCWNEPGLTT